MIINGAEPFLLPGSSKYGVLLVHGFTGSPSEMILLGNRLYHEGFTVLAPRLTGHGTSIYDMENTTSMQWLGSVYDGYHLLRGICENIYVVGLSMGGILTLKLGMEMPIKKAVIMSAPIFLAKEKNLRFLPNKAKSVGRFQRKNRRHIPEVAKRYNISYPQMPLLCVHELISFIEDVKTNLDKFTIPSLIIQSKNDHTVKAESGKYIYDHIASSKKEYFELDYSGHIITLDVEKDKAFEEIINFLR